MRDRGLAEWWCQAEMTDNETSVAVLNDVDALLETWSSKWLPWISNGMAPHVLPNFSNTSQTLQVSFSSFT